LVDKIVIFRKSQFKKYYISIINYTYFMENKDENLNVNNTGMMMVSAVNGRQRVVVLSINVNNDEVKIVNKSKGDDKRLSYKKKYKYEQSQRSKSLMRNNKI